MHRRAFLTICLLTVVPKRGRSAAAFANRKFAFKIKTKDGGIVGNVLIEVSDVKSAKVKLMKRFPGCLILSVPEK